MSKKKQGLLLSILGIIGLVAITVGITYAFFNYTKQGSTENTVTTNKITFLYTEIDTIGAGISISDALPIADSQGKILTGSGNVFHFKITSNTPSKSSIPYEITARMKDNSTLPQDAIKVYLTEVNGNIEKPLLLDNYDNLTQTSKVDTSKYIEKTIYQGRVPSNQNHYEKEFNLRMWIDDSINFSPVKGENGKDIYPYNNKTFTLTVNVYAEATVVTDSDIEQEQSTKILRASASGEVFKKVDSNNYEVTLPEGTTTTDITIETENPNATVKIEKENDTTTPNIYSLVPGDNLFKVIITGENRLDKKEYTFTVHVGMSNDATLKSLNVTDYNISPVFDRNSSNTAFTLSVPYEVTSLEVNAEKNDEKASINIVGNTDLKLGTNTITITVTAEDKTTKNYMITVTRESLDANRIGYENNDTTCKDVECSLNELYAKFYKGE